jgi:hypothetical protein
MNAKSDQVQGKRPIKLAAIAGALVAVLGLPTASASAAPGEFKRQYKVSAVTGKMEVSGRAGFGADFSDWSGGLYGNEPFEPVYHASVDRGGPGFFIAERKQGRVVGNGTVSADISTDLNQYGSYWGGPGTSTVDCDLERRVTMEPQIIFRNITGTGGKLIWDPGAHEGTPPLGGRMMVAPSWKCTAPFGTAYLRFWTEGGRCVSDTDLGLATFKNPPFTVHLSCKPDKEYMAPGVHPVTISGQHSMNVRVIARPR